MNLFFINIMVSWLSQRFDHSPFDFLNEVIPLFKVVLYAIPFIERYFAVNKASFSQDISFPELALCWS